MTCPLNGIISLDNIAIFQQYNNRNQKPADNTDTVCALFNQYRWKIIQVNYLTVDVFHVINLYQSDPLFLWVSIERNVQNIVKESNKTVNFPHSENMAHTLHTIYF